MEGVVALVTRVQSAATTLGDNAGSDKSLPSLWSLLPSIVVIGGQVCHVLCGFSPHLTQHATLRLVLHRNLIFGMYDLCYVSRLHQSRLQSFANIGSLLKARSSGHLLPWPLWAYSAVSFLLLYSRIFLQDLAWCRAQERVQSWRLLWEKISSPEAQAL